MSNEETTNLLRIVEFFGVPGVGKSYLVRNMLAQNFPRPLDRFTDAPRLKRVFLKVLIMLRHSRTVFSTLLLAKKITGQYSDVHWLRSSKIIFNWVFIDCVIRDAVKDGSSLIVLDQGITQALWSTQFGAIDRHNLNELTCLMHRFMEGLPVWEVAVVHVTAPDDVVRQRIKAREGQSPLDNDIGALTHALSVEQKTLSILRELETATAGRPTIRIIEYSNSGLPTSGAHDKHHGEQAMLRVRLSEAFQRTRKDDPP